MPASWRLNKCRVDRLPNFTLKLVRPGFGPAAELPTSSQARWRHGGCSSRLGSPNVIRGNRRAASGFGTPNRPHSLA
jgi:hypothetical protein